MQFQHMIKYWCEDEVTKKEFIEACATHFKTEFEQLFGEILQGSHCSVIRTSILEVALALTSAGLPLNGFNFDKVEAVNTAAKDIGDATATTTTASKNETSIAIWRPLEAKVQSQLQLKLLLSTSSSHDVINDLKNGAGNGSSSFSSQSSKDARLAFYQTADATKLKYDDFAHQIVTEADPECLEALIKILIAMVEVKSDGGCLANRNITEAELAVIELRHETLVMNGRLQGLWIIFSGLLLANYLNQLSQEIIFAWLKRFSELFDGSANDADMRLNLSLAIKANKVSLFCNQDNKTTAIEGLQDALMYAVLWLVTDDDYYVRKVVAEDILQSKKASLLQFESFLDNLCKSGKMHVISKLQHKLSPRGSDDSPKLSKQNSTEEEAAFDKSETNSWREDAVILDIIANKC